MAKEKEVEYLVHDDTGLKWEDLTEEEKKEMDEIDKRPETIAFEKKMKEEYGL